jgi:hypothetical protein
MIGFLVQSCLKLLLLPVHVLARLSKLSRLDRVILRIVLLTSVALLIRYYLLAAWRAFDDTYNYELRVQVDVERPTCEPIDGSRSPRVRINGRVYPPKLALSFNASINSACLNRASSTPRRILVWSRFFGTASMPEAVDNLRGCPVTNCEITHDRSRLAHSDMVLVHVVDRQDPKLPLHKPSAQRWVFAAYESPMHTRDLTSYNGYFNLTSSYRMDSDFPNFYRNGFDQRFTWTRNETFNKEHDYSRGKSEFAFALISNYRDKSKRLDYIDELRRHVPVSVYGSFGNKCPSGVADCREHLASRFKFYLAFENSICSEYITEKFFSALHLDVVPVVLGGGDYELHVISGTIRCQKQVKN